MNHGAIPFAWVSLSKHHRMDARFWLRVLAEVDRLQVRHDDLETIGPIVRQMEQDYGGEVVKVRPL